MLFDKLALISSIALTLFVGAAIYTLIPGYAYAVILFAIFAVLLHPSFQSSVFRYLPGSRVGGALLFGAAFLIATLRDDLNLRERGAHLLSLGAFLVSFTAAQLALDVPRHSEKGRITIVRLVCIAAMLSLLAAQLAEMLGYIPHPHSGTTSNLTIDQRPGGFLNPNMTAAIMLALLYVVFELQEKELPQLVQPLSLGIFGLSLALTQSRAALLFGGLYICLLLWRRQLSFGKLLFITVLIGLAVVAVVQGPILQVYLISIADRLREDLSYTERMAVMFRAWNLLGEAPFFGHGYRYMQHVFGVSTHNEILENAVNFGLIGSVVVWVAFFLMYQPRSVSLWVACIAPTLLFSHNFFETASFQVILGLACAVALRASMRDRGDLPLPLSR